MNVQLKKNNYIVDFIFYIFEAKIQGFVIQNVAKWKTKQNKKTLWLDGVCSYSFTMIESIHLKSNLENLGMDNLNSPNVS